FKTPIFGDVKLHKCSYVLDAKEAHEAHVVEAKNTYETRIGPCPHCKQHLLSFSVDQDQRRIAGIPDFDVLLHCPMCGTRLRKNHDDPGFFSKRREWPTASVCEDGHYSYSHRTAYCIQCGMRLLARIEFDFRDDTGVFHDKHTMPLPIALAGTKVVVRYPELR